MSDRHTRRQSGSRLKTYSHLERDRRLPKEYELVTSRRNSGLIAQPTTAFDDAIFLTAGARLDRSTVAGQRDVSLLPMYGASWLREAGTIHGLRCKLTLFVSESRRATGAH